MMMMMENKLLVICRSLFAGLDANYRNMKLLSWDIKYLHPRTGGVKDQALEIPNYWVKAIDRDIGPERIFLFGSK